MAATIDTVHAACTATTSFYLDVQNIQSLVIDQVEEVIEVAPEQSQEVAPEFNTELIKLYTVDCGGSISLPDVTATNSY